MLDLKLLEGTARYAGFTSSSCGGLRPPAKDFFALRAKKKLFMLFWLTLGHFRCSVVTSVTFSSNLSNFEKNPKNWKMSKNVEKSENLKKSTKIQKNLFFQKI